MRDMARNPVVGDKLKGPNVSIAIVAIEYGVWGETEVVTAVLDSDGNPIPDTRERTAPLWRWVERVKTLQSLGYITQPVGV